MCKYCDGTIEPLDSRFGLYEWNGIWKISTDGDDKEIFYCPMCGQKLSEIKEKATTEQ